jgi:Cu+-exporting ATPase
LWEETAISHGPEVADAGAMYDLVSITPTDGWEEQKLLRLAASLERAREHPLAAAIVGGTEEFGVELTKVESFDSVTEKAMPGRVDGQSVALGNRALLDQLQISAPDLINKAEDLRSDGQTVMFVAVDGKIAGLVGVADPIKPTTPDAISELH